MACGCVALAPRLGGAPDFLQDGVNGFLADTADATEVDRAVRSMVALSEAELRAIRLAGVESVAGFTPMRAAISELRVLGVA